MVFNDLVFLNANFYEKDGQERCYVTFASFSDGQIFSFAAHQWRKSDQPPLFSLCDVKGEIRQFGTRTSFILHDLDVVGQLDVIEREG